MISALKSLPKVFSFTFSQHITKKSYRNLTVILAVIFLILPALIMSAIEILGDDGDGEVKISCDADTVHVVDLSLYPIDDYSLLNKLGVPGFSDFSYIDYGTETDRAIDDAGRNTLLLFIDKPGDSYSATVVLPEASDLDMDDAEAYRRFLSDNFQYVLFSKSGIETNDIGGLSTPVMTEIVTATDGVDTQADEGISDSDPARAILSMILPYANIMVLYFMILFYGQGVANSVIMEKTSKLMDTFLISVKPVSMVMGKVSAITLSGLLQLAVWIACTAASFAAGTHIVKAINPNTSMGLVILFDNLSIFSGIFSLPTVIIAVLITLSGFLLYCSLAAVGGSLASKPEDLSSTNVLFSLTLIFSFFVSMNLGGSGLVSTKQWLNYFPFTSILITPSRVILGDVSIVAGLASLAITLISSFLFMLLAGKIYTMMSLYKGNPPSIRRVLEMLRSEKA